MIFKLDETFNKNLNMEINVQKTKILVRKRGNKIIKYIKLLLQNLDSVNHFIDVKLDLKRNT